MKNISNWLWTIIVYISKSEDPISVTIKITYGVQSLKSGYTNSQSNDFEKNFKNKNIIKFNHLYRCCIVYASLL